MTMLSFTTARRQWVLLVAVAVAFGSSVVVVDATVEAPNHQSGGDDDLPNGFYVLDPSSFRDDYFIWNGVDEDDNFDWAVDHIPFLDIVVEDNSNNNNDNDNPYNTTHPAVDLLSAYYYRWKSYRKHIHNTNEEAANSYYSGDDGYIVTEFSDPMPWGGLYGTIVAAAGHHIMEGRWLARPEIMNDYITYWLRKAMQWKNVTMTSHGGNNNNRDDRKKNKTKDDNEDPYPPISKYSHWIGYATWQRYLLDGNETFVRQWKEPLANLFRTVYIPKYLRNITETNATSSNANHGTKGATARIRRRQRAQQQHPHTATSPHLPVPEQCWWQEEGLDAMEVSISGSGCRPTMASFMFAEAQTIANLALLDGDDATRQEFTHWAHYSQAMVLNLHWNPTTQTFAVIPLAADNATYDQDHHPSELPQCNLTQVRQQKGRPLDGLRELFGYTPWYFVGLIPDATRARYLPQWRHLLDPQAFAGPYGLRTAEKRHACFNFSWIHGNCWNGPSWPYETSRVLTGAANLLNWPNEQEQNEYGEMESRHVEEGKRTRLQEKEDSTKTSRTIVNEEQESFVFSKSHYFDLLLQYARQHTQTYAINDTASPLHSGHIFENLHPELGYWNNRFYLYGRNSTKKEKGRDYNHSTFADLILSGLLGIRPQSDGTLLIHPLIPNDAGGKVVVSRFAVDHVPVRNRFLSMTWSSSAGGKYPKGLTVYLDGNVVAHRETMGPLRITPKQFINPASATTQ